MEDIPVPFSWRHKQRRFLLYEKFVLDWHDFLIDVQEVFYQTEDEILIKNLNMYVLSRFYYTPFDEKEAFYPQFYQRLEAAKELLKLEI